MKVFTLVQHGHYEMSVEVIVAEDVDRAMKIAKENAWADYWDLREIKTDQGEQFINIASYEE